MTYELCAPETLSPAPAKDAVLDGLRERMEQSKALGLTAQAAFFQKQLRHAEKKPGEFTPLTADETAIWKAWLPTCYRDDAHCPDTTSGVNFHSVRKMSSYMFDHVPSPVLGLWAKIKQQDVFDYYEIWTPEKIMEDPILLGVLGNERYLLARWGESDANFLGFVDVAKNLWAKRLDMNFALDLEPVWIGTYLALLVFVYVPIFAAGLVLLEVDHKVGSGVMIFGIIPASIATLFMTRHAMKNWQVCESWFIRVLFRLKPEDSWRYTQTEHLRAICRIFGRAPKAN